MGLRSLIVEAARQREEAVRAMLFVLVLRLPMTTWVSSVASWEGLVFQRRCWRGVGRSSTGMSGDASLGERWRRGVTMRDVI